MGVFQNNLMGAAAAAASAGGGGFYDYQISNSIRFNGTSQALEKTWGSSASDNNKKALSFWIKRSGNGNSAFGSTTNTKIVSANEFNLLQINTGNPSGYSDQFGYDFNNGNNGNWFLAKWRDPSAWMHIIWIWNSDESTAVDRLKVYINGVNYVVNNSAYWNNKYGNPYPASGEDSTFGKSGQEMHIARYHYNDAEWWGGQMADFIMIDGAASYTDFGEFKNGVWKPVDPSGLTFGNNGFHLNFASASDPGNDVSGNNNDFGVIGTIPAHDILGDSPTFDSDTNGGNFLTWNPLSQGSYSTIREGNLITASNTGADASYPSGNICFPTGKWYMEYLINSQSESWPNPGIVDIASTQAQDVTRGYFYAVRYLYNGTVEASSGEVMSNFGTVTIVNTGVASYSPGDIISWYIDADNKKAWVAKNGTIPNSGNPATGAYPQVTWTGTPPGLTIASGVYSSYHMTLNAGQDGTFAGEKTAQGNSDTTGYGNFYYAPPTDYLAVCAGNLPIADEVDPAQTDDDFPSKLFSPLIYTGNGSNRSITGLGFKPDLTWFKARSNTERWTTYNSTRGTGKYLTLNTNGDQGTDSSTLSGFIADGFSLGTNGFINGNGTTFVNYSWRMNGGTTATNTAGSINSTVQADPSGSMSIATFTGNGSGGASIGHGLSKKPSAAIFKLTSGNNDWMFLSSPEPTKYAYLNSTGAFQAGLYGGGRTFNSATSSLFYLEGAGEMNTSGGSMQAIFFANTAGFSQVGEFEGNGNADGSFVYTGFRPSFILTKNVGSSRHWNVWDDERNPFNETKLILNTDDNYAEYGTGSRSIDILSNGFKARTSDADVNENNVNNIYLAFAKNPFKYATAR